MGTPVAAAEHLQVVAGSPFQVIGVVTQPDRPKGRGRRLTAPPVKRAAEARGLPVFQPERPSSPEFVERLRELAPSLLVVVAYGHILTPDILAIPRLGAVNVHFSLLPELRGAAPVFWAIRRGYERTGVCTMYMDEGLDTGDVILSREEPILPADTTGTLETRLAGIGCELLADTLRLIADEAAPRRPQDDARATRAPLVRKEDGVVDWSEPAASIERLVRACQPWPGAVTTVDGRLLQITESAVAEFAGREGQPGEIVEVTNDAGLIVAAGSGFLRVTEVQPAGRRRMDASAFARGARLAPGVCLVGAASASGSHLPGRRREASRRRSASQ
jgi:methionyl-tRNA formyltransferase